MTIKDFKNFVASIPSEFDKRQLYIGYSRFYYTYTNDRISLGDHGEPPIRGKHGECCILSKGGKTEYMTPNNTLRGVIASCDDNIHNASYDENEHILIIPHFRHREDVTTREVFSIYRLKQIVANINSAYDDDELILRHPHWLMEDWGYLGDIKFKPISVSIKTKFENHDFNHDFNNKWSAMITFTIPDDRISSGFISIADFKDLINSKLNASHDDYRIEITYNYFSYHGLICHNFSHEEYVHAVMYDPDLNQIITTNGVSVRAFKRVINNIPSDCDNKQLTFQFPRHSFPRRPYEAPVGYYEDASHSYVPDNMSIYIDDSKRTAYISFTSAPAESDMFEIETFLHEPTAGNDLQTGDIIETYQEYYIVKTTETKWAWIPIDEYFELLNSTPPSASFANAPGGYHDLDPNKSYHVIARLKQTSDRWTPFGPSHDCIF